MIKNDVAISFKLLTFINSAYFKRPTAIDTIKDAMTFLGLQELKKFINVVVVSGINPGKTQRTDPALSDQGENVRTMRPCS